MFRSSQHEAVVSKFASLLGTKGAQKDAVASALVDSNPVAEVSRELMLCLSKQVEDHAVICTLPSLDMSKAEDETAGNPLPKVGEHRATAMPLPSKSSVPQMEASVLSNTADASANAAQVEQKAAQSLGTLTSWTKSSMAYAAGAISKNVSDSFSSLVDSRVRAWTLLLLRHSLTTGDSASRSRLLSMLSSIVKVKSATTAFKTLPLPDAAAGQPKEADVILPLLLEVDMQVFIQGKSDVVTLRAPGTISGNFEKIESGLGLGVVRADIRLDTIAFLDSMVQQARMVVFKAVAKATSANQAMQLDPNGELTPTQPLQPSAAAPQAVAPSISRMSGFSSALNMTSISEAIPEQAPAVPREGTHQPAHRLQKARHSALKLNSVLQGGPGKPNGNSAFDKNRKSRSIQWDHRMDLPKVKSPAIPMPKRQRVAQTTARLTSFKSFGRPHGGDFGSGPRNATFGDFGRKPIWGRDGKLANHPTPMQANENQSQDLLTPSSSTNTKNATFDFQRPSIHLSSGLDLGAARKNRTQGNNVPNSIPRTATALEGWLMEKTGGNF